MAINNTQQVDVDLQQIKKDARRAIDAFRTRRDLYEAIQCIEDSSPVTIVDGVVLKQVTIDQEEHYLVSLSGIDLAVTVTGDPFNEIRRVLLGILDLHEIQSSSLELIASVKEFTQDDLIALEDLSYSDEHVQETICGLEFDSEPAEDDVNTIRVRMGHGWIEVGNGHYGAKLILKNTLNIALAQSGLVTTTK